MYDTLQLVRGCVAKRELVPLLSHFCITQGRIQGANGHVCLDAPCPALGELHATVQADKFLRAAEACKWEPNISATASELTLRRSKFTARLPVCDPAQYPRMEPGQGPRVPCPDNLLDVLRAVEPFIGEDATRPWSITVRYEGGNLYACNNVSAACTPLAGGDEPWCLPVWGVNELLRVGEVPEYFTFEHNNMTFHYKGGAWLRVSTTHCQWPDVHALIHRAHEGAQLVPLAEGLIEGLDTLQHFADKATAFRVDVLDNAATCGGATVADVGIPDSAWALPVLRAVVGVAQRVDWGRYPSPVPFAGRAVVGVAIGLRA